MSESFERFADDELAGLLRFAVVLTGDRELAQDLVQDVMLKAHSQWARVSTAAYPRSYVRAMITNEHLSWRRRWSVRNVLYRPAELLDTNPTDDGTEAVDQRAQMRSLLATLPRQQRAVLVLRHYESLTDDEIAHILGCTTGTVRSHASRALSTLRKQTGVEGLPAELPQESS